MRWARDSSELGGRGEKSEAMVLLVMKFDLKNLVFVLLMVMEENAWEVEAQQTQSAAEVPGRLVNTGPHTAMMSFAESKRAIRTDRKITL